MLTPTPPGLPLRHPACWLATWFGSGLLPAVPGTWGSLAAMPFGIAILWLGGSPALFVAAAILFPLGWWAAERYVRHDGREDPGPVVVDEVVGQWLVLLAAEGSDWRVYALAFVLFRAFDIVKPWPVRWAEQRFAGGLGVMLDDVLAALYAFIVLTIIIKIGILEVVF